MPQLNCKYDTKQLICYFFYVLVKVENKAEKYI